ncbi:MAG: PIG-L family deacetylase, partial [Armatimonadetes bacterium]|nr:PIG-L family deacetylase [Armatimonadota bacterium]
MNYSSILVFGAHPDDEITMAGTMAKLASLGVRVLVCTCTDGSEGYPNPDWRDRIVEMRRQEMAECDKVLGVAYRYRLDRPDMALENNKENFKAIMRIIREARPDAVFTHGPED